jgi:hypothetical protein
MDSFENNVPGPNEGWKDASYNWEHMQEGIFDKITEEDPNFFAKEKKRKPVIWFWWVLGVLVPLVALALWTQRSTDTLPAEEIPSGESSPALERGPIATPTEPENSLDQEATVIVAKQVDLPGSKKPVEVLAALEIPERSIYIPLEIVADSLANQKLEVEPRPSEELIAEVPLTPLPGQAAMPLATSWPTTNPSKVGLSIPASSSPSTLAVSVIGGASFAGASYKSQDLIADFRNQHSGHYWGTFLGVEAQRSLGKGQLISAGVSQEVGYQYIDYDFSRAVEVLQQNVLLSVTHYVVGERTAYEYGDTLLNGTEYTRLAQYNQFMFTRLHLNYGVEHSLGPWHVQGRVGVVGSWMNATGRNVTSDLSIITYDRAQPIHRAWQVLGSFGGQIDRVVTPRWRIFLRYQFDQQLSSGSLENGLTWRPGFHRISVGGRYQW